MYIEKDKHLGLRIDKNTHYKLHYISKYEGSSANGQILYLVRKCIAKFENEHVEIDLEDKE